MTGSFDRIVSNLDAAVFLIQGQCNYRIWILKGEDRGWTDEER